MSKSGGRDPILHVTVCSTVGLAFDWTRGGKTVINSPDDELRGLKNRFLPLLLGRNYCVQKTHFSKCDKQS